MFEFTTKIIFDPIDITNKHKQQSTWKKVVICETQCNIDQYYAWFLNKRYNLVLNKPLRNPHVTIINDIVDEDLYQQAKQLLNGTQLTFKYNPDEIRTNTKHWWMKVYSDHASAIRSSVGLNPIPHSPFHLTIGHANEKNIEHSKYILQIIKFHNL